MIRESLKPILIRVVIIGLIYTIANFANNQLVIFFIIPGLLVTTGLKSSEKPISLSINVLGFSVVWWISSFWVLKFINLSFDTWVSNSSLLMSVVFVLLPLLSKSQRNLPEIQPKKEFVSLILLIASYLYYSSLLKNIIAPLGADMATHLYTAKVINFYNTFPPSYEPIVPINTFGEQPFGFSVIAAIIESFHNNDILKVGVVSTIISFSFYPPVLYCTLRRYFSSFVSLISIFIHTFFVWNFVTYMNTGTVPYITSLTFSVLLVNTFIQYRNNILNQVIISGLITLAIVTTHPIPVIYLFYSSLFLIVYFVLIKKSKIAKSIILTGLISFILSLPLLLSQKPVSQDTFQYLKQWQSEFFESSMHIPQLKLLFFKYLFQPLWYVSYNLGGVYITLALIGLTRLIRKHNGRENLYPVTYILLAVTYILILNSPLWFLPFSPAIFPDRILSILSVITLIPISSFIENALSYVGMYGSIKYQIKTIFLTVFLVMGLFIYYYTLHTQEIIYATEDEIMISYNDLDTFNYIKENTPKNSIILNNYGDAGIYIPAVTGRKIVTNDGFPHNYNDPNWNKKTDYDYIFIGDKISKYFKTHPESVLISINNIDWNTYKTVFQSGNAVLLEKR